MHETNQIHTLITSALPLVQRIASRLAERWRLGGDDRDDLVAAGHEALVTAARRYDPARSVSFRSFVRPRVRGAMLDLIRREGQIPRRAYMELRARKQRVVAAGSKPGKHLHAHLARISAALNLGLLAAPEMQDDRAVAVSALSGPESMVRLKEVGDRLRQAVAQLPPLQRQVVQGHYFEGRSLRQLAEELERSPSKVTRLHQKGLENLGAILGPHPTE